MSKRTFRMAVMGGLVFWISACTTSPEQKSIESQIEKEPRTFSQQQMVAKGHSILLNHPDMTEEQRRKMKRVYAETMAKSQKIRMEMSKVKGVFFKQLFKSTRNDKELRILRKKLIDLNEKKMDVMFDALYEAQTILGKGFPAEEIPVQFNLIEHL